MCSLRITTKISDDCKSAILTFSPSVVHRAIVDEAALTHWIEATGRLRASLLPQVPATWNSAAVEAERNPAWFIEADSLAADALLHVRDPRYGWLHYILTKSEARRLGEALRAQADAPAPIMRGEA